MGRGLGSWFGNEMDGGVPMPIAVTVTVTVARWISSV